MVASTARRSLPSTQEVPDPCTSIATPSSARRPRLFLDVQLPSGCGRSGDRNRAERVGFIDSREKAETVMAFVADPAVGKEPGIWRAWLVVRYDAVA